jgi:arabinose-5-phosphate isomerase
MQSSIKQTALRTLQMEAQSIQDLTAYVNDDFEKAINAIAGCKGRLVISGIGKSAVIAQKIVATLNSTGTPSVFMHAADAIHGDLGIVQKEDVVMIISNSGSSPEIKILTPLIKNFGNVLIAMIGNTDSFSGQAIEHYLKYHRTTGGMSKQFGTHYQHNRTVGNGGCYSCMPDGIKRV